MAMKRLVALTIFTFLTLALSWAPVPQARADEVESLRKEVEALREAMKAQQGAILRELQEIKTLLGRRPAPAAPQAAVPQDVTLSIDGDPFKGAPNAKVTLIEFSDYQCPFCARHFRETLSKLDADYAQTGKVRYVFRNFPLESIHPQAFKAAEAASCAGEQGKYWEMHARLFENQKTLGLPDLPRHAEALGLDTQRFAECLSSGKHSAKIRKDMTEAQRAGVTGTPTFFIGLTEPGTSRVKAVRRLTGAQPYENFKEAIDGLLSQGR